MKQYQCGELLGEEQSDKMPFFTISGIKHTSGTNFTYGCSVIRQPMLGMRTGDSSMERIPPKPELARIYGGALSQSSRKASRYIYTWGVATAPAAMTKVCKYSVRRGLWLPNCHLP